MSIFFEYLFLDFVVQLSKIKVICHSRKSLTYAYKLRCKEVYFLNDLKLLLNCVIKTGLPSGVNLGNYNLRSSRRQATQPLPKTHTYDLDIVNICYVNASCSNKTLRLICTYFNCLRSKFTGKNGLFIILTDSLYLQDSVAQREKFEKKIYP